MSDPLEKYLAAQRLLFRSDAGIAAWTLLKEAADDWRLANRRFYSGYAMDAALHAVWGNLTLMNEAIRACLEDYARCVDDSPLDSREALAALFLWRQTLSSCEPTAATQLLAETLGREFAERLVVVFGDTPEGKGYLIDEPKRSLGGHSPRIPRGRRDPTGRWCWSTNLFLAVGVRNVSPAWRLPGHAGDSRPPAR